ncbi:MAG: hypothetical protein ACJ8GN_18095 [Longimicrobiaceae bacterium]
MHLSFRSLAPTILLSAIALASVSHAEAQNNREPFRDPFPASRWCEDSGTACWRSPDESDWFNGIRIIADFDVRFLFQRGRNRFVQTGFLSLPKLAFEVNLYKSWVAFQIAIRGPGEIEIDSLSATRGVVRGNRGIIPSDIGLSAGFSFLDSSVALLFGRMVYDRRYFTIPKCADRAAVEAEVNRRRTAIAPVQASCLVAADLRDSYVYLTFQPLSAIRSGIKQGDEERSDTTGTAQASRSLWILPRLP